MPGICLTVVAVAAMLVVGRGSAMAMVDEAATAAAEEADDGWGGRGGLRECTPFIFTSSNFSSQGCDSSGFNFFDEASLFKTLGGSQNWSKRFRTDLDLSKPVLNLV